MKRGLVFTLSAMAVLAAASVGRAQTIDLTLNLRYNDPAAPAEGGVWYLLGKTTGGTPNAGIAAVSAYLTNVTTNVFHGSTVPLPAGQNAAHGAYPNVGQATINNITNGGNPFNGTFSGAVNVLYGQDISTGPPAPPAIIGGIGQGAGAHNVATDVLGNSTYNNYSVLLSGTFTSATRPAFAALSGNTITGGNVLANTTAGTAALAATIAAGNLKVRGDSLGSLNLNAAPGQGLRPGDVNRDGKVDPTDLAIFGSNWGPSATDRTWDRGDFDNSGSIDPTDLAALGSAWNPSGSAYQPPAVTAIPEPTSAVLAACMAIGMSLGARRRLA